MSARVFYVTHSTSADNEARLAAGWNQSALTDVGRAQAVELGERWRGESLDAVFASDLRRSSETAAIAFGDHVAPVFLDWRLRECDYGDLNGAPSADVHDQRVARLTTPYPNGESWTQAVARCNAAFDDIAARFRGGRVLVVGHIATRWALWHHVDGSSLADLAVAPFEWQEHWEFTL